MEDQLADIFSNLPSQNNQPAASAAAAAGGNNLDDIFSGSSQPLAQPQTNVNAGDKYSVLGSFYNNQNTAGMGQQ